MQNQEIIKIIENLKGRKDYEQKKATKLGFNTLYAYFEDKIIKEKKALEDDKQKLKEIKVCNEIINEDKLKKKKNCSCC